MHLITCSVFVISNTSISNTSIHNNSRTSTNAGITNIDASIIGTSALCVCLPVCMNV